MNHSLRVGIVIPQDPPTAGGAYSFQTLISREILKRIATTGQDEKIIYIPIYLDNKEKRRAAGQNNKSLVIRVNRSDRAISLLQQGIIGLIDLFSRQEKLVPKASSIVHRLVSRHIDVIWSLTPSRISDQIPYITTIWDLQHRLQPFFPEISRLRRWETQETHYKDLTRKAFTCIVGTNRGRQELQQFYGIDESRILVNPFPCPVPSSISCSSKFKTTENNPLIHGDFIIYPAQLWSHKNHLCSLLAVQELKKRGFDLQIVFTGSGKGYESALNYWIKELGLDNRIHNLGFVSSETLAKLYKDSLALFFPSFFGPDNIPPLEAMAYGTPAIVADVPGAREQLKNAALYFNPNSYVDAANKIESIIRDKSLRSTLIAHGSSLVSTLTAAAYVDAVEKHLLENMLMLKAISAVYEAN